MAFSSVAPALYRNPPESACHGPLT